MSTNPVIVTPGLPDKPYYSVEELVLAKRFTRATYKAEHSGVQAPPWDREKRIKRWELPMPPGANPKKSVELQTFANSQQFEPFVLTWEEIASINLPGLYEFAKFEVAPTPAKIFGAGGLVFDANPEYWSRRDEAESLLTTLRGSFDSEAIREGVLGGPFKIEWNGEVRRNWQILVNNQWYTVGPLLKGRHANGVGAPGKWVTEGSVFKWVSAVNPNDVGEFDTRPEIPFPYRPLEPVERLFKMSGVGGTIVIRTDMESEFNPKQPTSGGGVPSDLADTLTKMSKQVAEIHTSVANLPVVLAQALAGR